MTTPELVAWTRRHTTTLTGLAPDTGLDDLEPLRDLVADARVVGIGEGAHFVEEFTLVKQRLLRFLAERCGFTVVALEYSFPGGPALDRWVRGVDDRPLHRVAPAATRWGATGLMTWLREHNTGPWPLRLDGIDLPEAGGALRPSLEPLAALLETADPDAVPLVRQAIDIGDDFLTGIDSGAAAAPAWAALPVERREALTAVLARLRLRLAAVRPLLVERAGVGTAELADRLVATAQATDYQFGAMHGLRSGTGLTADMSVRERFMADTLLWQLRRAGPDARVALVSHNNHVQKTPSVFDGVTIGYPLGQQLGDALGGDYVAIAVSQTADHIPEMVPEADSPVGFRLADVPLDPPPAGSVEHALDRAGFAGRATLTDLRDAPAELDAVRTQSAVVTTPVAAAFDAIVTTPTVTRDATVAF